MTDVIVLRVNELFLKRGNRHFFESKMLEHIRRQIKPLAGARVHKYHMRILVEIAAEDRGRAIERLGRVFGISSMSPARVVEPTLDAIGEEAIRAAREAAARLGGKPTFKVETNRSDKTFPLGSPEISREIGARVFVATALPVDVHHPGIQIGVEIGPERTFVFAETVPGPGGLPVGATGHVNLLLSGGIDSPVAGWMAMKRGCTLDATYFHSFPYTGDKTKEKVLDLARLLAPWQGTVKVRVVNFTDVQKRLREHGPAELAVILYRRMMVRVAAQLAKDHGALALVTGESLAQVASQTLENMIAVEDAAPPPMPILRPLLTFDKLETVAVAKRIGTFETSIQPYEDCCALFVPPHPVTRARLKDVIRGEAGLDLEAMTRDLVAGTETIEVRE